jgi:uncharacterized hydrophobic protein (TIGR00271 family)
MLHLRLSTGEADAASIGSRLAGIAGVERVFAVPSPDRGATILSADVEAGAADELVDLMETHQIHADDYVLTRLDVVAPISSRHTRRAGAGAFAWVEVLGEARVNSRPLARFLVLMAVAGLIAALGVIKANGILIVGAMAVSPDLLPVSATCVGIVGRRWQLARRSFATLVVGLTLVALVAMLLAFLLDVTGILPSDYRVGQGGIGDLADTDYTIVLVALAAGVTAMLAFETRASAAVGVAISVTTIPASAYLGVAFGVGEGANGLGALLVLAINVSLLIFSGCLTLAAQRAMLTRRESQTTPR